MSVLFEQLDDRRAHSFARADIDVEKEVPAGATGAAKRAMDLMIAIPALVFLSPLLLILGLIIRLQDGGPAIFAQTRYGRGGQKFTCFKFRSMVIDAPERLRKLLAEDPEAAAEWERDQKLRKDPRITAIGRFIRKTSLDELPQLLNIIRGDMSVVGPRPIVKNEIAKYEELFPYYAAVRPGVTGLWQVSGRNDVSYRERVEMDAQYARTWSLRGDVMIVLKTFTVIVTSKGAY